MTISGTYAPFWQGVFLSASRLTDLKQRIAEKQKPTYAAFLRLKLSAEAQLDRQPDPPQVWYVPAFYVDGPGHQKAKASLAGDANSAYEFALMYRMTDNEKYALASARLINAWTVGVEQMRREDDSLLSFSYHFPAFIFAADLVKDSICWPREQQLSFQNFVRDKAVGMNTMDHANNWGNWGLVLVLASASYLHDTKLFEQGIARWKEFVETQIADDGHLPHEVGRNYGVGELGLWYSHFTLMPQTIAAEIALVNGVDLYDYRSPGGHTLRHAFERLARWVRDPNTFPYFHPTKEHPEQKSLTYISYWEILSRHWPNANATAMLATMRPLTASHSTPDLTFTHGDL